MSYFYLEPCERDFTEILLEDDFEDDSVVIVLDRATSRATSRERRDFTAKDFKDVGALYVEDVMRLADWENAYAQRLWDAERDMILAERNSFTAEQRRGENRSRQTYHKALEEAEANTMRNFDQFRRILLIRLDKKCKENVLNVVRKLQQREYIIVAEPNYIPIPENVSPNDHYYRLPITNVNHQWAVDKIRLPQAWGVTTGSNTVQVGIIGHGIDASHPELTGRVTAAPGGSTTNAFDTGTRQAGIIGARGNNSIGIAGIAWNVRLVSFAANGSTTAHAAAINQASQMGIPILTRSFALDSGTNNVIFNAVRAYKGLFINSAGNEGQNTDSAPRLPGLSNVLIVGASNMNDGRSVWNSNQSSNYGQSSVHIFAPGGGQINGADRDNITTYSQNSYGFYSGTSAAAPHVAGVAALVLSRSPNATAQLLRLAILEGSDNISISTPGGQQTVKRLNAFKAVTAIPEIIMIRGRQIRTDLTSLSLVDMGLTNSDILPLRFMANLRTLDLSDNAITDLSPLSGLVRLESLNLGYNHFITNLTPLSGLVNLRVLDLCRNRIINLAPLSGLTNLERLFLNSNQISNITPLSGLTRLKGLSLSDNQITNTAPVNTLIWLEWLFLNNNRISNIAPLNELGFLTRLDLSDNQISNIAALAEMSIHYLYLRNNRIISIEPLRNSFLLHELDLSNNQISSVAPLSMHHLEILLLQDNQISDVSSLTGLIDLWLLVLVNNPLTEDQVDELRGWLPNCMIDF
ncbi:MAG: leucine-rich repeat domain-containing protein [Oscillospiraceae bacterium]|nr:leucine-rich repeat domain-containing protein [Oscillospiraceae bacterium]